MDRDEARIREVYAAWKSGRTPGTHPDDQAFVCFIEGLLSAEESSRVREHLLSCPGCACRLKAHVNLQPPAQDPPPELIEKSRRLLERLIGMHIMELELLASGALLQIANTSGDVLVGQEFVPAGLFRGRKPQDFRDGLTVLKDFRDIRVELRVEARKQHFCLNVSCKDKETQTARAGMRVSLFSEEMELESYVAMAGKAVFEHVPAGKYRIIVSSENAAHATLLVDIRWLNPQTA